MKFLNPNPHGYMDYLLSAFLLLAPTFFDFEGTPAALCYGFGVVQITMSLLTRYPMGALQWIPFPIHGSCEMAIAILLASTPWIFNFAALEAPRNIFVAAGAALFGVWFATDYYRIAVDAVARQDRSARDMAPMPFPRPKLYDRRTRDAA